MRRILAWLLVVPCVAWAAVRLLGLERGYPLVQLVAYTPLAAVGALLVAAVCAGLRQRRQAFVAGAVGVALIVAIAPRVLGGPADGDGVRILTANILHDATPAEAIVALVERTDADVLSLQEVSRAKVGELKAAGLTGGWVVGERTALWSRLPIVPRPGDYATGMVLGVEVVAVHPTAPLNAAWTSDWQRDQEALPRGGGRILAGDFNATLDHAQFRDLIGSGYVDAAERAGGGLRSTWPVGRRFPPPVTIDHVLAPEGSAITDYEVHALRRSDHRAVLAEVVLPD